MLIQYLRIQDVVKWTNCGSSVYIQDKLLSPPSSKPYSQTEAASCLREFQNAFGKMVLPLGWYPSCLTPQAAL